MQCECVSITPSQSVEFVAEPGIAGRRSSSAVMSETTDEPVRRSLNCDECRMAPAIQNPPVGSRHPYAGRPFWGLAPFGEL